MPTEQDFQALVKRVEELEAFQASATAGLVNHMESIDTHDKLILELQQRSKMMAENVTRGANKLTEYFNRQR